MGFAEPWLLLVQRQSKVAHRLGDPVIRKQWVGQREDPIRAVAFHQSHYWVRSPRTTFTRNSALPQMACAPAACDSRRVPACAPAP